jgi:hypothetical protein
MAVALTSNITSPQNVKILEELLKTDFAREIFIFGIKPGALSEDNPESDGCET